MLQRVILSFVVAAWSYDTLHFDLYDDTLLRVVIVFAHVVCATMAIRAIWRDRVPA